MRAALVTGVSRRAGIGYAIAQRLEQAGARVFTQGWPTDDAAPSIEADFAEPDSPARVVAAAHHTLGPLDVLVVNHAHSELGRLEDLTAAEIDTTCT